MFYGGLDAEFFHDPEAEAGVKLGDCGVGAADDLKKIRGVVFEERCSLVPLSN